MIILGTFGHIHNHRKRKIPSISLAASTKGNSTTAELLLHQRNSDNKYSRQIIGYLTCCWCAFPRFCRFAPLLRWKSNSVAVEYPSATTHSIHCWLDTSNRNVNRLVGGYKLIFNRRIKNCSIKSKYASIPLIAAAC